MKKLYFILALFFAFSATTFAQMTNPCNPEFGMQISAPGTVQVTPAINTTTNEIHHAWRFGDGSNDYTTAPSHTYAVGGVYTVMHILYRSNNTGAATCIDSTSHVITIVLPCNLSAQFTSQTAATNSLGVQFTNTSAGFNPGDSIKWSFGDGTYSYDANPYHAYANAGTYNVCLRVKRNSLSTTNCVSEICHTVTVTAPFVCNLAVSYTYTATPNGPNVISFTNTSTGYAAADSISWTFGDGTSSTQSNPTHTYTTGGTYHVCLIIKRVVPPGVAPCQNYVCHDIAITVPAVCNLQASYTVSPTNTPMQYHFQNTSSGFNTGDSIRWSFGDGTYSFDVNPTHTYASAGVYQICVWVKKNNNTSAVPCISEHCGSLTVPVPCNQHASFTYQIDPNQPGHVIFTNISTGMMTDDSTIWSFGDGTYASTFNTDHVFTATGNYTVCLKVKRNAVTAGGVPTLSCADDTCVTISITLPNPCNLQVYFTAQSGTGTAPNNFTFTNLSTGYAAGDSVTWSFGDGTYANTFNATHVYTANGNYTVCLRIKKNNTAAGTVPCIREYCRTISVTLPTTCNLQAAFYDSTMANTYTHVFFNWTTPLNASDSIKWTLGDGTSSNAQNPLHTYAQPGTYTVCLRVQQRNPNGVLTNCVSEICRQTIVQQICNLQPSWTHSATATNPLLVNFTNTTTTTVTSSSATWSFGDGTTATGWNQTHTYAQAGTYYVCLRIQYGNCVAYKCDSVSVQPLPVQCNQLANFHTLTPSAAGNSITVTPNNISAGVTYTWTFGDGTGSNSTTASYTYAVAGTYTVCLTAYRNNSCAATSCLSMQVPNCNLAVVNFSDQRDSLMPNKIKFTASSTGTITDQVWTITKTPSTVASVTIHANNPTYTFSDTGYYNVCLKVTLLGGCVKTICKQIHITQVVMPATGACSVQVYPNPATTEINAVLTLSQPALINAYVYNSVNVLVAQKQQQGLTGNNTVSINIATLPAGVYILRLVYGTQVCYVTFLE